MPADPPDLAIIVVTYNSGAEIGDCLESVVGRTAPYDAQVVVVDNRSTDGTPALVRTRWPAVRVIDAGGNLGFARANNLGIAATASEYVLLLNPDTVVPPGAIRALVDALERNADAAVAGPRLVDATGAAELSFGPPISPWGELKQKLLMTLYHRRVAPVARHVERRSREAGDRAWVSGACLLIRRADLEAVGGLDERFFMYTEDVDLCTSVRARGRRVLFVPGAEVRHLRGRSASRNPETERLRRQSHLAYYEKHLPLWVGPLRLYLRLTGKAAHV
ncbi:MAG: glycosyltransferase family 2 protein [Acidobacteria bacterium]|nr:glycosyltransferase family 2 protein [Acidobacteriota bacterium]